MSSLCSLFMDAAIPLHAENGNEMLMIAQQNRRWCGAKSSLELAQGHNPIVIKVHVQT